jgi:hypothetical protein
MHTTEINDTTFIHHGSYEGDVILRRQNEELLVPFDDLKEFIARYVADARISRLENASADEVLGIPPTQ